MNGLIESCKSSSFTLSSNLAFVDFKVPCKITNSVKVVIFLIEVSLTEISQLISVFTVLSVFPFNWSRRSSSCLIVVATSAFVFGIRIGATLTTTPCWSNDWSNGWSNVETAFLPHFDFVLMMFNCF